MSQKNMFFIECQIGRSAHLSRRAIKAKAYAKKSVRRQERHQGKSLMATELQLLQGELQYQNAVNAALKVIQDFESKEAARRLAETRSQFRAFAEQQCIPLQSLVEVNAETIWAPPRNRTTFEIESNGTKLVLASCAL